MYGDNYPNATLTHWSNGEHCNGIFEINSFGKRGETYYIKTDTLLGEHSDSLLAHDSEFTKMAHLFDSFADTDLIREGSFF